MAHRPMPKPDPAGRTFPVQRPSLPTVAPDQKLAETRLLSLTAPKDVSKSQRDYWAFAFGTLLIAAMLVLGWRIGKIFLGRSSSVQKQSLTSTRTGLEVPKPALPEITLRNKPLDNATKIAPDIDLHNGLNTSQAKTFGNAKALRASPIVSHEEAQNKPTTGPVVIRALVGRDGKVQMAQVIRGNRRLSVAALAMVRQLSFNPYAPHGTPLEFETEVTVSEAGARGSGDGIQFSIPRESETPQPVATPVAAEKPSK
jgi:TonB family protein